MEFLPDNPFVRRFRSGTLADREDLQVCFRQTAKLVHPDTSPYTKDHEAFAKLKAQYEEALEWLAAQGGRAPRKVEKTRKTARPPEGERRDDFLGDLQSLLARGWPMTRGRESRDASLRRHISRACLSFDAWQTRHRGLFLELETCRLSMLQPAARPPASEATAWQQVMVYLNALLWAYSFPGPNSRTLVAREAEEALQKAKRRASMEPAERFISLLLQEFSAPKARSDEKRRGQC
ncbi:MAG: hypothetical protein J0L75_04865 [Spirochaetes bacterium]|nr:hypothetical protein [Spirochaetota bacterium]